MWNALKDFKTDTSNGKGTKKVVLQSYEVLAQLKATNSHATRNMFKLRKDFIVGTPSTTVISLNSPNSTKADCPSPTLRPTISPNSNKGPFEKPKTKQEMLQLQSRSLATMASHFPMTLEIYDALLAAKMDINHECKNKVKISNLKAAQGLGVISKEEFRAH